MVITLLASLACLVVYVGLASSNKPLAAQPPTDSAHPAGHSIQSAPGGAQLVTLLHAPRCLVRVVLLLLEAHPVRHAACNIQSPLVHVLLAPRQLVRQ